MGQDETEATTSTTGASQARGAASGLCCDALHGARTTISSRGSSATGRGRKWQRVVSVAAIIAALTAVVALAATCAIRKHASAGRDNRR
jgi:hypothetical protein